MLSLIMLSIKHTTNESLPIQELEYMIVVKTRKRKADDHVCFNYYSLTTSKLTIIVGFIWYRLILHGSVLLQYYLQAKRLIRSSYTNIQKWNSQ